jgi:intracellular septation protein A
METDILKKDPENSIGEAVTGEIIDTETVTILAAGSQKELLDPAVIERRRLYIRYFFLPFVFLTVALLGGLRISGLDQSFIFLRPSLICLVFASILLVLFFRAGLITIDGWFSETFTLPKNFANGAIMLSLFAASTQLFNSLIPEQGIPFWIIAFCFLWTLWNNLFADFDTKKLLRSLGALFGLAFVTKYLLLANLTAPAGRSWLRSLIENPTQEALTWLLDLPRFAPATGYIQFFAILFFLLGLYLLPRTTRS